LEIELFKLHSYDTLKSKKENIISSNSNLRNLFITDV